MIILRQLRHYSSSSKGWMSRQANDPYVRAAKSSHYRARSAFKLVQINQKYRILHRGDVVVDCGASPGGWSQVIAEKVQKPGLVIGIDILPIEPIPNVHIVKGNFLKLKTQNDIRAILDGRPVDVVLSDMAPSFSGNHTADHARSMELCESALIFAEKVLSPGGNFVAKYLMGGTEHLFSKKLQTMFAKVKHEKPDSSRKQSTEKFFVAMGYRPLKKTLSQPETNSDSKVSEVDIINNSNANSNNQNVIISEQIESTKID